MNTFTKSVRSFAFFMVVALGVSLTALAATRGNCCPGDCCEQACCHTAHR